MSNTSGKVRVAVSDRRGCRSVEAPGKEFEDLLNALSVSEHGKATIVVSPMTPSRDRWIDSNTCGSVMSRLVEITEAHDLVLDLLNFGARAGVLLADAIARSATLEGLWLKYCSIPADDWEAVCEALKNNYTLKSVRLVQCDVEMTSFAGALKVNESISELVIDQELGDSGGFTSRQHCKIIQHFESYA